MNGGVRDILAELPDTEYRLPTMELYVFKKKALCWSLTLNMAYEAVNTAIRNACKAVTAIIVCDTFFCVCVAYLSSALGVIDNFRQATFTASLNPPPPISNNIEHYHCRRRQRHHRQRHHR